MTDAKTGTPLNSFMVAEDHDRGPGGEGKGPVSFSDGADCGTPAPSPGSAPEKGRVVLESERPELDLEIMVYAPGYAMQCVHSPGKTAQVTEDIQVALVPDPGITVHVQDGQGQPVPNARVQFVVKPRGEETRGVSRISNELFFFKIPFSKTFDGLPVTDKTGAISLPRPCGDIHQIEVATDNHIAQQAELPKGGDLLTITLNAGDASIAEPMDGPARKVVLHVSDASTGKPVERFWVNHEYDSRESVPGTTGVSMSEFDIEKQDIHEEDFHTKGMIILTVRPPELNLDIRVFASGYAMQCVQSPGASVGTSEEQNIALKPDPGIALRVVDGQNQPVSGAQVQYVLARHSTPGAAEGISVNFDAPLFFNRIPFSGELDPGPITLADGTLPLSRPCGDIHSIEISAPGGVTQRLEIPADSNPMSVTLKPGADIKVVARAGEKPFPSLSLSANSGAAHYATMTDEQGATHFMGVSPGTLTVKGYASLHRLDMPDKPTATTIRYVPKGDLDLSLRLSRKLEVVPGIPSELAIDLPPLEEASFKVALKPVGDPGVVIFWQLGYVVLLDPEGDSLVGTIMNTVASFTIKAPRRGRMLVSLSGMASREETWYGRLLCELDKVQGETLEIPVLRGMATLTGEVPPAYVGKNGMINIVEKTVRDFLNFDGKPLSFKSAGVAQRMIAPLEKDGRFTIPSLPPGQYEVYLTCFGPSRTAKMGAGEVAINENATARDISLGSVTVPESGEVHFTPQQ